MIKQQWLWAVILVLLAASLPGLYDRWQAEESNKTYEVAVPHQEIFELTLEDDSEVTESQALTRLAEAGMNTVSFVPETLRTWQGAEVTEIYWKDEMETLLQFSDQYDKLIEDEEGIYITRPEDAYYTDQLEEAFEPVELTINDQEMYFIPGDEEDIPEQVIGYDEAAIERVKEHGLNYTLRLKNTYSEEEEDSELTAEDLERNQKLVDEVLEMKDEHVENLLFSGTDVIGYPNLDQMNQWIAQLNEAGYSFYSIEFTHQRGLQMLARETDYDVIRLHSLDSTEKEPAAMTDQAVRAVKERNIRSLFVHLNTDFEENDPMELLEWNASFIAGIHEEMPAEFQPGVPEPFEEVQTPVWIQMVLLLAGIVFTYVASSIIKNQPLRLAAAAFMAMLAIGYFILDRLLLLQAFALAIAVIAPVYAVLSTYRADTSTIGKISFQYLKALGISVIGILIVIGLLNGNAFMTGFEMFRGVSVVYFAPIAFLLGYFFWRPVWNIIRQQGIKLLNKEITYGHVLILIVGGAVLWYYDSRQGNQAIVSGAEILIRNLLEETLYVRPRTKEFLIGFPLFILALYMMNVSKIWGKLLLIPGVIGFLSIVNTFTHLHIPMEISLLRTVYSVIIGFLIGVLLIYVFKGIRRYLPELKKKRWS